MTATLPTLAESRLAHLKRLRRIRWALGVIGAALVVCMVLPRWGIPERWSAWSSIGWGWGFERLWDALRDAMGRAEGHQRAYAFDRVFTLGLGPALLLGALMGARAAGIVAVTAFGGVLLAVLASISPAWSWGSIESWLTADAPRFLLVLIAVLLGWIRVRGPVPPTRGLLAATALLLLFAFAWPVATDLFDGGPRSILRSGQPDDAMTIVLWIVAGTLGVGSLAVSLWPDRVGRLANWLYVLAVFVAMAGGAIASLVVLLQFETADLWPVPPSRRELVEPWFEWTALSFACVLGAAALRPAGRAGDRTVRRAGRTFK